MYSVLLKAPLSPYTGYGNDGIGIARALLRMGLDVHLAPMVVQAPLPSEVAALLAKDHKGSFDFLIHHVDPGALGVAPKEQRLAQRTAAWSMWEFPSFVEADGPWVEDWPLTLLGYDVVMPYDRISEEAMLKGMDHPGAKVHQGGYEPDFWYEADPTMRRQDDVFRFGMAGQLHNRKNPFVAIKAFKKLKDLLGPEFNAELHLKTTVPSLHPAMQEWCPGLFIHLESWSPEKMRDFYSGLDVYVAPSWGEGKNLPALEAATTGAMPLLSNTGGHAMWLTDDIGVGLPGTYETVDDDKQAFIVEPDDLAAAMLGCYENREKVRGRGLQARESLPWRMSWENKVNEMVRILESSGTIRDETHRP